MQWSCPDCGLGPIEVRGAVVHRCKARAPISPSHQHAALIAELPEESRKLIGDRLAELFAAIGLPECGGCEKRKQWLNAAHRWLVQG